MSSRLARLGLALLITLCGLLWIRLTAASVTIAELTAEVERLRYKLGEAEHKARLDGLQKEEACKADCDAKVRSLMALTQDPEPSAAATVAAATAAAQHRGDDASAKGASATAAAEPGDVSCEPAEEELVCEPFTFWSTGGSHGEGELEQMDIVREHLKQSLGWKAGLEETAAFIIDSGELPPVKRGCSMPEGHGVRLTGPFEHELAMCHKDVLAKIVREAPEGSALRESAPRTLQATDPALEREVPCLGENSRYITKGVAHGGREIWQPETFEDLRARLGLKGCPENKVNQTRVSELPAFEIRIVQEIIHTLQWEDRNILSRSYFAVLRRGQTNMCTTRGRWKLGLGVGYDLYMFTEPYFVLYEGVVLDNAPKHRTLRRNGTELDSFLKTMPASAGFPIRIGESFTHSTFMPYVAEVTKAAFMASEYFLDSPDTYNRAGLEPDGSYFFFAAEFLLEPKGGIRLVEYTSVPQVTSVTHGPSTATLPDRLGKQFAALLLRTAGQQGSRERRALLDSPDWRRLASKEAFPHP